MCLRCVKGQPPQWMHDRSSDDAGSLGWLVGEHVGEHVIKPKLRSFRGRKRRTGKQKRKSAGAGGLPGRDFARRRRRRSDGESRVVCRFTYSPARPLFHLNRFIAPLPRFSPRVPLILSPPLILVVLSRDQLCQAVQ